MLEKAKKNLKVYSWIIIISAVLTAFIDSIYSFITQEYFDEIVLGVLNQPDFPQEAAPILKAITMIMLGVGIVFSLILSLYIGIRGLGLANGTYKGKAYMFWLTVALILEAIAVISLVVSAMGEGISNALPDISKQLVSALFILGAWLETRKIKKLSKL